ncbi:PadR family transcriptional regulator PadR [Enterococcus sp. PF1-24]|uniref:PadR family transcriptional regulator n=1 Tax=unclassified Enterococcus TaxID=2608891 RepID=UPI002477046D|nr:MULTISPECIES: PadR family transcriptional regulator [unclassified Enterococcus]MDH6364625.1 PadR family transcriptional regulator PadR [Enterococcus sp. PFB1-1]MDH6401726.1 PadR family transcriptional regulator PadR [Enterococcus sp. PF1-24]
MDSQLKKGIIEYCILASLKQNDSYGYQIVKNISALLPITESTLYPILKRLEVSGRVQTYTKEHKGRLRKYYQVTDLGISSIDNFLQNDWEQLEKIHDYIQSVADLY